MAGRRAVWNDGPAFRARLVRLQEQKGWSDYKISRVTGLSERAYSYLKSGERMEPMAGTVIKLAKAFGVTTDYLLMGT